jgi:nucleoside-diphosphate-sugar epimerase
VESKLKLRARGNPYGESIARAMDAFYDPRGLPLDARIDGHTGATVIRLCEAMGALADLPREDLASSATPIVAKSAETPRILVLGGTGFIGKELVRQLTGSGQAVRLLVRSAAGIPENMQTPELEWQIGDLGNREDVLRAVQGVDCVFHLARANVKSWADYRQLEIEATRRVAECALEAGVKRFIYTGTIDSYYAGRGAGTITEETPLDTRIERRNLYARAKARSEEILMLMHRERGLPVVIVRPGIVIGRGGSPFHWGVGMWWHEAVCQIWGDGKNKLALVLVDDVAKGLISAMETPGIEGRSFNLIGDPCLSAQEYLDELDRAGGIRIQRHATPIFKFYLRDMLKWMVKVAVRHPERRMPSYRDWESRTGRAVFDCTAAKTTLGWQPVSDRGELVRRGIEEPLLESWR